MEFYDPIAKLVGNEGGYIFNEPSSLDVLIYGHLISHLTPDLDDSSLRNALPQNYPELTQYLRDIHSDLQTQDIEFTYGESPWDKLVKGWGNEPGKRLHDFIGVGTAIGGI